MNDDTYKTIAESAQGLYREKGSRFISYAWPVTNQEEIKTIIEKTRKEYHDARHHCYAWMLGRERQNWRVNDDGEPSGTAGRPILGQINSNELTNILIVVIRYFGGTLLGVSGLINAYRTAAGSAIENSEIIERILQAYYRLTFPYSSMNDVMKILKDENAGQTDQRFDTGCKMTVNFRLSSREKIISRLDRIEGMEYEFLETR